MPPKNDDIIYVQTPSYLFSISIKPLKGHSISSFSDLVMEGQLDWLMWIDSARGKKSF